VFEDEFGISFTEPVGTTWAPRGKTPHLKRIGKYRREISCMAGLTISGRIFTKCCEGSVSSEKLIQGLEHFRRCIGRPLILIWDRSRAHRSKRTKAYLADHSDIYVESLPAYAPETNPEEFCHGNIKRSIKNIVFSSKQDIPQLLHKKFAALRKRPALLLACFHHAGLALNQLW